jgi:hypothetical protein
MVAGAWRTAHGSRRDVGDQAVEEGEAALHRTGGRVGRRDVARAVPPVRDVPPSRSGQRPPELLDREAGAQRREVESLQQRPARQRADDDAGVEDVARPGGVDGVDPQRWYRRLLAGGGVDGQGPVTARGHHGEGYAVREQVQGVVR